MMADETSLATGRWAMAAVALLLAVVAAPAQATAGDELGDVVHTETLDNGLEVVVLPDSSVPVATIELTVRHGAFAEAQEFDGLAHLYEHMFFKGNEQIPNQTEYMERIRELGMTFNGTTSTERVNYFFTLPSDNLSEGLEFMYHATTSPLFDEEEFEREKEVVFGEADRAQSNPRYWLRRAMAEHLWFEHPHRKHPLGDMEVVGDATVEQMEQIQQTYYVPNNSVLAIVGDVDVEEAVELAQRHFGDWERGEDPFEVEPVPEHPPLEETSVTLVEDTIQTPTFRFAWHGPSVDEDPDATYAADVLLHILRQPTSRFQQNLVDSRIALSATKSYFTQRHVGPISVSVDARPDNLIEAIRATLEEVYALADPDYYTDEQLEAAITRLNASEIYSREKTSDFVHTLTFWWATAGLDYYFDYLPNLREVTREDIARYVEDYILDEEFVLGVLVSEQHQAELELTEEQLEQLVEDMLDDIQSTGDETARTHPAEGGRR